MILPDPRQHAADRSQITNRLHTLSYSPDHSNKREWAFTQARLFNDHLEDQKKPSRKLVVADHGQLKAEFRYKPT